VSAAAYSPAIYEGMNLTGLGTGVLAREAAIRVGPAGSVAGIDLEYGMIAVA
jgi:ubiquinone/menaquinone biosynthesis C-methylase UbiE